jgi:hypothetical protein
VTGVATTDGVLHHAALLYAPGERPLARAFFELLGCDVEDSRSPFLLGRLGSGSATGDDHWMFASEVTSDQWALEQALVDALHDGVLADAGAQYRARVRADPQHACHFAIRYSTLDDLDAVVDRIERVDENTPVLAGRVSLSGVFRPGDPGSVSTTQTQAFVYTDVVASGLLAFGQHIELQWER